MKIEKLMKKFLFFSYKYKKENINLFYWLITTQINTIEFLNQFFYEIKNKNEKNLNNFFIYLEKLFENFTLLNHKSCNIF